MNSGKKQIKQDPSEIQTLRRKAPLRYMDA